MIPRAFWEREAQLAMTECSRQAARGRGFDGRALAPKKARKGGGSLGRDGAGPGIAGMLLQGRVRAARNGFRVDYGHLPPLVYFDRGTPHQPQRKVIGISRRHRAGVVVRLKRELRRVVEQRLRGGR